MQATDIRCPHCGRESGMVCANSRGRALWGKPHAARKRAIEKLRKENGLPSRGQIPFNLFVRLEDKAGTRIVEHYEHIGAGVWGKQAAHLHNSPRMTLAMNDDMRDMMARGIPETHPAPFVTYRMYRRVGEIRDNRWVIVCGNVPHYRDNFRVVNLITGEESSLYTFEECEEIVSHARGNKLQGSFAIDCKTGEAEFIRE